MTQLHPIIADVFERFGIKPGEKDSVPWVDDRLRAIYVFLGELRENYHPEDGVSEALKRAYDAVEEADCELAR